MENLKSATAAKTSGGSQGTPPTGPSPRFLLFLIITLFAIIGIDFFNRYLNSSVSKNEKLPEADVNASY